MSGETKSKGVSPSQEVVAHSRCGLPPIVYGWRIVCPACFDVVQRKNAKDAAQTWNDIQRQVFDTQP